MKKIKGLVLVILVLCSVLGCDKEGGHVLQETTQEYTLEQAKSEKCLVHENGAVTYGKEYWSQFVTDTKKGEPKEIKLVSYYTLEDKVQYDAEFYESIKDEYPQLFVNDLKFNGTEYIYYDNSDGQVRVKKYKYLMKFEGKEDEVNHDLYDSYIRYVLTNDNTLTLEAIVKSWLSSTWEDHNIECCCVYTEYIKVEK